MRMFQYKILFRHWGKNKIYPCISTFSLVIGLTCSTLLIGFAMHEQHTAHSTPGEDQLYVVQTKDNFYHNSELKTYDTPVGAAQKLHEKYPQVAGYCTFRQEFVVMHRGKHKQEIDNAYKVTPGFDTLFQPKMISGNLKQTLSQPLEIAITRSFALRTFGKENPLGEVLTLETYKDVFVKDGEGYGVSQQQVNQDYTITSVIDDRPPSVLYYELLFGLSPEEIARQPFSTSWYHNVVQVQARSDRSTLQEKINQDENANPLFLLPIEQAYYTKDYSENRLFRYRDYKQLQTSLYIALLILIIACFNHVNINMTRSFQRLLYSGQQLIHGASRNEIRWQVIQETVLQVGFAFLISLALIYMVLPKFNAFMDSRLTFSDLFRGETLSIIFYTLVAVILFPSIYILYKAERVALANILRKNYTFHRSLIAGIIVVQFTISIILLALFLTIKGQTEYITHIRPDAESIISIEHEYTPNEHSWKTFKEQVITLSEVVDYTSTLPLMNGAIANREFNANTLKMDQRFFHFYHAELVAGDSLCHTSDISTHKVLVNESLIRKKQIENPIGQSFSHDGMDFVICGVIKDYAIDHVTNEVEPLIIIRETDDWVNARGSVIKTRLGEVEATIARMQSLWKTIAPDESPLVFTSLAEIYRDIHKEEFRTARIVSIFTWISMLLSCMGLFGLAWYSVECRTKEICLRKVNGATEKQIVLLVCGRFVKWMIWASLLGIPIAWYLANTWISQFVYRAELSPWIFITSILLVIMIGIITVIRQSWYAATLNPIDTLKTE